MPDEGSEHIFLVLLVRAESLGCLFLADSGNERLAVSSPDRHRTTLSSGRILIPQHAAETKIILL